MPESLSERLGVVKICKTGQGCETASGFKHAVQRPGASGKDGGVRVEN